MSSQNYEPRRLFFVVLIVIVLANLWIIGPFGRGAPLPEAGDASNAAAAVPWQTIVASQQTVPERLATVDLQRYLGQVTGHVPVVVTVAQWREHPGPAMVLGTLSANPLLAQLSLSERDLGEQGYYLANQVVSGVPVVIVAAQQPEGAVHAVYGLLRELGFGFFLGSESAPEKLPTMLPASPLVRKPVFAIRGVLPWYNFFNSPTAWDPIDHRALVDQLIRSGANFVGFHSYDYEPFAAYEENGAMKWGERLRSTQTPNWGTHSVPAKDFPYGTSQLFADDYFGAATTHIPQDARNVIQLEQDIMRDALDYAHQRGLHTCLGFEVTGDPTRADNRAVFLKRVNRLLDQYPSLDYLWIWQPEAQGVTGFAEPNPSTISTLEAYTIARRSVFRRVVERSTGEPGFLQDNAPGQTARAREGARLEQYAQLAGRALGHREHGPKLVISGWGGDDRLLSADYYEGLDKLLPPEVIFSSLDFIVPRPRIDKIYQELPPQRQRWPIPWLEYDGDQWHPQPWVHIYETLAKVAQQGGSQGLLGIHWRTRDVEENLAFLVDYAWQPGLTATAFFEQYARRGYAPAIASPMAAIHNELDQLGYRWVNGGGQSECGNFAWGPGVAPRAQALRALQERARALLPQAGASRSRLQWLINEMEWVLRFQQAETTVTRARGLFQQNQPQEALALLNGEDLAKALHAYAQRLTTRGEYGVLATIETKAWVAWRDLRNQCLAALNQKGESLPASSWKPAPQILLPRFLSTVEPNADLELMPISLGGNPVWVHYRALGHPSWTSQALANVRGWVWRAVIPVQALSSPGLELGFSFKPSPDQAMEFGPVTVTVMPVTTVAKQPLAAIASAAASQLNLAAKTNALFPLELSWDKAPAADYFKVYRDETYLGETAVPYFPDAPTSPAKQHRYAVEAWRDGHVITRAELTSDTPNVPLTEKPLPVVSADRRNLLLTWPPQSLQVAAYQIRLQPTASDTVAQVVQIPAARSGANLFSTNLLSGDWTIDLAPINQTGRAGTATHIALSWPPRFTQQSHELRLDQKPDLARLEGNVRFADNGAHFAGGRLEIPHQEWMDLNRQMTLSFEFKADDTDGMPVLICHGVWQLDGWFVQILGNQLIIRTPHGDANGPGIESGKWYAIRWEFDGAQHRLLVDGREVQRTTPLAPAPAKRNLRIGQYESPEPVYAFHGTLRNLKFESHQVQFSSLSIK